MATPIEEIKARLSVVDVVSSYVKLQRAGANFKAPCPFHSERTPSFFVSPARDTWHCFGCSRGGDQFSFVMEMEGVEFREALDILASRAGVEVRDTAPEERSERSHLLSLMEEATRFYQLQLSKTPAVLSYLRGRGVVTESLKAFRVGYAPDQWRNVSDFLRGRGYSDAELEKAGLTIRKQDTSFYDRFRNRIIFPVTDSNSRVIGFGGRIFEKAQMSNIKLQNDEQSIPAKYINSPQTVLYDKSKVLYGFDKAKITIRKENTGILVEGYMDALMAHQAGVANTVAVSGTALTYPQLQALRRLCDRLLTAFDMDEAGESATRRSVESALAFGFDVRAVFLPGAKDPADIVRENPALWKEQIEKAEHVVTFFLMRALEKWDAHTVEGKRMISRLVLPLVARVSHEIERAHWVTKVAAALGVREEAVEGDLRRISVADNDERSQTGENTRRGPALDGAGRKTRLQLLEERLLGLLLLSSKPLPLPLSFVYPAHQEVASSLSAGVPFPERLHALTNRLIFEAEVAVEEKERENEVRACMREIERETLREKLEELSLSIRKMEEEGKAEAVETLALEFSSVSKRLSLL